MTTTIRTLVLGTHVAHLEPFAGEGLLVCPPGPAQGGSLPVPDWLMALEMLDSLGWSVDENAAGDVIVEGYTLNDAKVIGLYARHPMSREPDAARDAALSALHTLAGVVPGSHRAD